MGIGDWGLGIGDWGLGIGPNPQSPIPNPQSPIPNPHYEFLLLIYLLKKILIINIKFILLIIFSLKKILNFILIIRNYNTNLISVLYIDKINN